MPKHSPAMLLSYLSERQKKFVRAIITVKTSDVDIAKSLGMTKDEYETEYTSILRFMQIDVTATPELQRKQLSLAYDGFQTLLEQQKLKNNARSSLDILSPKKEIVFKNYRGGYSQAFKKILVENIKALARARGMVYHSLGEKVGKTSSFMSNLASLSARVDTELIEKFAHVLGVDTSFLIVGHAYLSGEIEAELKRYTFQRQDTDNNTAA